MPNRFRLAAAMLIGCAGAASAQQITLRSDWGTVTAVLEDNAAASALADMLPLTIRMGDHLRQEKTGVLPQGLPDLPRQRDFTAGMLGLWGDDDFVIYFRDGRVPRPGIVPLGQVNGDVSIFDRPGDVTITIDAD